VSPTNAELKVGDTLRLVATIAPNDATNKTVAWSSSDTAVATVGNDGMVTAIKEGTATITATTEDSRKTAQCTISVSTDDSDNEPPDNQDSVDCIAKGNLWVNGQCTISEPPDNQDSVDCIAKGNLWVNGQCTIYEPEVSVSLPATFAVVTGKTATLTATITTTNDAPNYGYTWLSSAPNVATVDSQSSRTNTVSFAITGVTTGTAVISVTAKNGGYTAQCSVYVSAENVRYVGDASNVTAAVATLEPSTGVLTISGAGPTNTQFASLFINSNRDSTITSVVVEEGITAISAFAECHMLTSLSIPASVTSIGYKVCDNCFSLTEIIVDPANTHYVSVDGVLFTKNMDTLMQYPLNNARTTYAIPNSVTTIMDFSETSELTEITMGDNVTTIVRDAFYGLKNLRTLTLSANVTTLSGWSLANLMMLTTLYNRAATPQVFTQNPFDDGPIMSTPIENVTLYVPAASVDAYKAADVWKDFANILPITE
jgi:uncharacterized protein YjdB